MPKKRKIPEFLDEQELLEKAYSKHARIITDTQVDYIQYDEGRRVSEEEREDIMKREMDYFRSNYHHERSREELEQYHVYWDDISAEHIMKLKAALEEATSEQDIQKFLTENSIFLVQHLGGGHGRYVIPKPRLGSNLIPDFLLAELSSFGIEWYGVELESPHASYFTANGQAASLLTHAVQQVLDWRAWLKSNLPYARTTKSERGLGLVGISDDLPATIFIGRRRNKIPARFNDYRKQIKTDLRIEIHTYDWLVEQSEIRVRSLESSNKPDGFDI